jgi:Trypsin-like peptidase domain
MGLVSSVLAKLTRAGGVALCLCALTQEGSAAESELLRSLAPPPSTEALRAFSSITLKPIGRVDMRLDQRGVARSKNGSFNYSVVIEGYSVFSRDGSFIQRDDHILSIVFGASGSTGGGGTVTMKWNGAPLASGLYEPSGRLHSIAFKLGDLPDPESLDISSGAKISRNRALQQVGFLARFAFQGMNTARVPLPSGQVSVGQALLPTDPLAAKVWMVDDLILPFMRGSNEDVSSSARQRALDELSVPQWINEARIRGVTRKDGFDYIDYAGYMEVAIEPVPNGEIFLGDIRCLIDPFSGIVRSAVADGRYRGLDELGSSAEMTMQMRFETAVEQSVAPPAPNPPAAPPTTAPSQSAPTEFAALLPPPSPPAASASTADLYDRSIPSVVTIVAGGSQGSGFFIAEGIVVTNAHVVGKETNVMVYGQNGKGRPGTVLAADDTLDVAFVRTAKGVKPLPLAADLPRTGEQALIIGSPFGLDGTLTGGLVSSVRVIDGVKYVQTDAPINSGNSGGPVLDAVGRVIGMATWKLRGAKEGFEGLGFAVAATEIRKKFTNQ